MWKKKRFLEGRGLIKVKKRLEGEKDIVVKKEKGKMERLKEKDLLGEVLGKIKKNKIG